MSVDHPPTEAARLDALRRYQRVETSAHEVFTRVTTLAAATFDVPVAQVVMIDAVWCRVLGSYGPAPLSEATPREGSPCDRVVRQQRVLVTDPSGTDPSSTDPSSTDLSGDVQNDDASFWTDYRFYAGAPLVTPEGLCVGTLCIADRMRRTFGDAERERLRAFAATVVEGLELRLALRRTASQDDLLHSVFSAANVGICVIDEAGYFWQVNDAYGAIYGYAPDELLGRPFTMMYPPSERDAVLRDHRAFLAGETDYPSRREVQHSSGKVVEVEASAARLVDDEGERYRITTSTDISERLRADEALRESERRFRSLFEAASVGIVVVDRAGRMQMMNDRFAEIFGYDRDDLHNAPLAHLLPDAAKARHAEHFARYFAAPKKRLMGSERRLAGQHRSGHDVPVEASLSSLEFAGEPMGLAFVIDVSERAAQQERLRLLESAVTHATDAVLITDATPLDEPGPRIVYASPGFRDMTGYEPSEVVGRSPRFLQGRDTDRATLDRIRAALEAREPTRAELLNYRRDNTPYWIELNLAPVSDAQGAHRYWVSVQRDITERKHQEQIAVQHSRVLEHLARRAPLYSVMEQLITLAEMQSGMVGGVWLRQDDALVCCTAPQLPDTYRRRLDVTELAAATPATYAVRTSEPVLIADFSAESRWPDFIRQAYERGFRSCWAIPIADRQTQALGVLWLWSETVKSETVKSEAVEEADEARLAQLHEAAKLAAIAVEQQQLSDALVQQTNYDQLTGLPNRALMLDRLEQSMLQARRYDRAVAAIIIDIDNFKVINDSLGRAVGDEVLREVAARLQSTLRDDDTIARLGGDEFGLALPLDRIEDTSIVVDKVTSALRPSIDIDGQEVYLTTSLGISLYPDDGCDPETLVRNADTAVYAAKRSGKNRAHFYTYTLKLRANEQLALESDLRHALEHDQFALYYQPWVVLPSRRIIGAEALIRWNHPERGLLTPANFIPYAEESGLIEAIDRWVLRQAIAQARDWQVQGRDLTLSINLSVRWLHDQDFVALLLREFEASEIDVSRLELEITESAVMVDAGRTTQQLLDLKRRAPGLRIALDDFGSGYSSLGYLQKLPLDTLKIDRSFVADLSSTQSAQERSLAILRTIATLGVNLGLRVVAEGVETDMQCQMLTALGCHEMQGYYVARPLVLADFDTLLSRDNESA